MTAKQITIPSFDFTAFYYPEILDALIAFKRKNLPELTDESPQEPTIQFMRAFALVGHLNNALIDLVANESTLVTAKLAATVRNMLRLIDYELAAASPAQVLIVYELGRTFIGTYVVVPLRAQCATKRDSVTAAILYESDYAVSVTDTNVVGYASSQDGLVNTVRTAAVNSAVGADDFSPWAGAAVVNDAFYIGHADVMFDRVDLVVQTNGSGFVGVWEYYDADFIDAAPDAVSVVSGQLRVTLNSWLGIADQTGKVVRVTLASTGTYDEAAVQYASGENFVDVGLLGQSSPSLVETDYSVGSDWSALALSVDTTNGLTQTGNVQFELPQSETAWWKKWQTPEGASVWAVRFRVTSPGGSPPSIRTASISEGKQYVAAQCTQGRTVADIPLGSSTGLPDQRFTLANKNHIRGSQIIRVDSEDWVEVSSFLESGPGSKHYVVQLGDNDTATVVFGSGDQGAIPPVGANNIAATAYRVDAVVNGNVGASAINVDKSGLSFVSKLWNPRQANGWSEAEGSTEESLERAKQIAPAQLRVIEVALGPDDVSTLAMKYTDPSGARPVSRSFVIEEGLGPKTMQLIAVAKGGGLLTSDQLIGLSAYFNGDDTVDPPVKKKVVSNQEVTAFNYTQRAIDVTAVVATTASEEAVTNAIKLLLQPESVDASGAYNWKFGGTVPRSRIEHEIFGVEGRTTKADVTLSSSEVQLGALELPKPGTISVQIIAP